MPHLCVCVCVYTVEGLLELKLFYIQVTTPPSLSISYHPLWVYLCHHPNLR